MRSVAEKKLQELIQQKALTEAQASNMRLFELKQELEIAIKIKDNLERETREKDETITKIRVENEEMLELMNQQEEQISRADKTHELLTQRLLHLTSQIKDQAATEKAIEAKYNKPKSTVSTQTF